MLSVIKLSVAAPTRSMTRTQLKILIRNKRSSLSWQVARVKEREKMKPVWTFFPFLTNLICSSVGINFGSSVRQGLQTENRIRRSVEEFTWNTNSGWKTTNITSVFTLWTSDNPMWNFVPAAQWLNTWLTILRARVRIWQLAQGESKQWKKLFFVLKDDWEPKSWI